MAYSSPLFRPRQSWLLPQRNRRSFSMCFIIHFPIIRRKIFPTAMGLTTGFLFSCLRQALYAANCLSEFFSVASLLAILDIVFATLTEFSLKQVTIRLLSFASKPNGPWQPWCSWPLFKLPLR